MGKNASEFQQGYRAALQDVLNILDGVTHGTHVTDETLVEDVREFVETGLGKR